MTHLERVAMKSQELPLLKVVLQDLGDRCNTSTSRDFETVTARFEHEGFSFLTITLPDFGKGFERALDRGSVLASDFPSFGSSGCLPRFLKGFTEQVFDRNSGTLLDKPSVDAIQAVRQVTLMFGKVLVPCSDARNQAAIDKYVQTDKEVDERQYEYPPDLLAKFQRVSDVLFRDVFYAVEQTLYDAGDIPKHGPGATADRLRGNGKFRQRTWTKRLDQVFPFVDYLFPSPRHYCYDSDEGAINILPRDRELPVKVTLVPKTLKTPRIIAVEPTCMQYVQQGLMELFVKGLEDHRSLKHLIGFTKQEPNQELARVGSFSGALATLDLSEASDRVSNLLVATMTDRQPLLRDAIQACRSLQADVPGHGVMRLAKFASMGSALCFPMEAMVFLTIVIMGVADSRKVPVTQKLARQLQGQVRVYGDDIIVPVHSVETVMTYLEAFGFVVNDRKSFWTGKFRESCGKEYYDGTDVSIVRYRRMFPTSLRDVNGVISLVSFRNQCYNAGMWQVARYLDGHLKRILNGNFPTVHPSSPALGRHTFLPVRGDRMCPHLHRDLVKGYVVSDVIPVDELDGSDALLKFFLKRGEKPLEQGHLRRSGRPHAVYTKLRWVPPY
jgi:hypothetical protein